MSEVTEDYQDIFEDEVVEEKVEVVVEEQVEEPEATEEPEQVEEPEKAEEVEPEEPTTDSEKDSWKITAVLDEREKRQKAVREVEELRKKLEAYEKPQDDISIFEDEKGFIEKQEQRTAEALRNTALNMSEAFAESVFGEEKVAAAKAWMQSEGIKSPYALDRFNAAKLPYHEIVKLYDDDQVRRDPEGYKAKLREEILAELDKDKKPKSITPSLASKRSVGDSHTSAEDFDDLLKD